MFGSHTDAREILRFAEGQESWCLIGNMMPKRKTL